MKSAFKCFFTFYLNTWWFPPLLAVVVFLIVPRNITTDIKYMGYFFMIQMAGFIGIPVSWGWFLAKGNWRGALWSFLATLAIVLLPMIFFTIMMTIHPIKP